MKDYIAGKYISQGTYRSFQPELINRSWMLDNMELIRLLSQADRQLGRLDMYSEYIPNIDLFIRMHVLKEATQSSKIEGTKTDIEEALFDKSEIEKEKRDDWEELHNYTRALNEAIDKLGTIPFSSRLIKQTHKTLLSGVRGTHRLPGEFRNSQNWIGGASIMDAVFVPPIHTSVPDYMSDLEKFAHNEEYFFPELLKIALIHYQFETIHPFLDGNGRVGRLMITLYLVEKSILKRPILYLSDFFERNRILYYDNLMRVRDKSDIVQWFKFFLVGVLETAKSSITTFDNILKLQKEIESRLQGIGSIKPARTLIRHLYEYPIVNMPKAKEVTGLTPPSVYKLLSELENLGILREVTGNKRRRTYLFKEYVDLFL